MIELVTYLDNGKLYVSHGINHNTDRIVILPQDPLTHFPHERDESGLLILIEKQ